MGSTRKLQGEIDRVLKKVQEGVDVFDSIWNKVYDTENANQKEKFEADLKKEIKKLQRYRDQIKTWIQSSEIKEKKALLDARKLIEREMERFKVCEKETKTKAFSKEGLGQQPKTDPREKAKGESRDWLNNMVSELESQIDSFEAEMEGHTGKNRKTRPPRLTHLEDSTARHKQHINKLELILRLLENDGLSPEEVNDVKEFVEDYVDRNQDDFEEFMEVEDLYQSLPLDKLEALEALEAIPVVAPAIIVKEKVAVAAASGVPAPNGTSVKSPVAIPGAAQAKSERQEDNQDNLGEERDEGMTKVTAAAGPTAAVAVTPQASPPSLSEEVTTLDAPGKLGIRSPYTQTGNGDSPTSAVASSVSSAGTGTLAASGSPLLMSGLGSVTTPVSLLGGSPSVRGLGRTTSPTLQSSPVNLGGLSKEVEAGNGGRRVLASIGDGGPTRAAVGRGNASGQSPPHLGGYLSTGGIVGTDEVGTGPGVPESRKAGFVGDERLGSVGLAQQLATRLGAQDRGYAQSGGLVDSGGMSEGVPVQEGGINGIRMFPPSVGGQWRLQTASTFQNQSESGQYHSRTEIAPDQKQKYLQRLQEQQQGQSASAALMQNGPVQLPSFQQLEQQQASLTQPSRSSALQHQQMTLELGLSQQHSSISSSQGQQQQLVQQFTRSQSSQQVRTGPLSESATAKDISDPRAVEQQHFQPPPPRPSEENNSDMNSLTTSFGRSASLSEDDSKNADTFDVVVGDPGTLAELSQLSRDVDFNPKHTIRTEPPLKGPGVIGMRSSTDSGPKSDNSGTTSSNTVTHDQIYNQAALDAAYRDLPLSKDSERQKIYIPRYPAATPTSYPQVPAALMENPALWERLETDVLFLSFYYQQGTFQQYLAARELKKQSWRYHKKYNTWFQRHEEPKIATDEFEQGTYVYFDFHIAPDDCQQGWCQRIKSEFTFEYSYLEDELVL